MNILLLNHELSPLGGGAGRATHHIAECLVRMGHDVHCITTNANGKYPTREVRCGYTIHRVPGFRKPSGQNRLGPTSLSYLLCGRLRASGILREFQPDVVHSFFTVPGGILGAWVKRMCGAPLVVSLRGSDVPGYDPSKRIVKCLRPLIIRVWQVSDAVVALSEGLLRLARESAPLSDAIWIHNGVNASEFPCKVWADDDTTEDKRLLAVARLEPFKGLDVMLDAVAQLIKAGDTNFSLRVVGDGPLRSALDAQVGQLGLAKHVTFCGAVPPDTMAGIYADADCLVHPALNEAFGQVLTEAMACGLPIAATRTGGIPQIVKDGQNGWLVPPADPDALAGVLRRVIALPRAELVKLGKANAAYVRDRFSWESVASAYADMYQVLANAVAGE